MKKIVDRRGSRRFPKAVSNPARPTKPIAKAARQKDHPRPPSRPKTVEAHVNETMSERITLRLERELMRAALHWGADNAIRNLSVIARRALVQMLQRDGYLPKPAARAEA